MSVVARAVLVVLVVAGCAGSDSDSGDAEGSVGLTPTFPAAPAATSTAAPVPPASGPLPPGTEPVEPGTAPASPSTTAGAAGTASITDSQGDLTPSVLPPPPWADLVGGRVTRSDDGFELRVALGGGTAPSSSGDPDQTMNVASFYDVDGDGSVDFEVWANLADGGWGGSWFDNREGTAAFGDDAAVAITVEGPEVVIRFPLEHVGGAAAFRWALASEWGRYEAIGTELAARDDAPDDDQPADFPS